MTFKDCLNSLVYEKKLAHNELVMRYKFWNLSKTLFLDRFREVKQAFNGLEEWTVSFYDNREIYYYEQDKVSLKFGNYKLEVIFTPKNNRVQIISFLNENGIGDFLFSDHITKLNNSLCENLIIEHLNRMKTSIKGNKLT